MARSPEPRCAGRCARRDGPEIKGYMPAMEMSCPVNPPKLIEGVKSGDRIGFTVDAASSTITDLKVIDAGK